MFSWFRKKKPEQPVAAPAADIELVRGEVAFANHQRSWSEPYDSVDALRRVLGARGLPAGQRGDSVVLGDYVFEPRMTFFQPQDDGSKRTTTIIRIIHDRLMPRSASAVQKPIFEYQHAIGPDMQQSLASGFESWARLDLPVLLDAVESEPQNCLILNLETADGTRRRALLGPVGHARERPLESVDPDEHDFCPCCLFTRCGDAFKAQIEGPGTFAIRLYAVRDTAGRVQADCRVNGDDYETGKTALVRYVPTWPDCGFEFRKQYALLHAPQ